jgi:hypothetical protein
MVNDHNLRLYRIQQAATKCFDSWKKADFSPSQKAFLTDFAHYVREIARAVREEEADIAVFPG